MDDTGRIQTLAVHIAKKELRGKVRIGCLNWVRALEQPTKCFRCWRYQRLFTQFRSNIDRSRVCIKRGWSSYKVAMGIENVFVLDKFSTKNQWTSGKLNSISNQLNQGTHAEYVRCDTRSGTNIGAVYVSNRWRQIAQLRPSSGFGVVVGGINFHTSLYYGPPSLPPDGFIDFWMDCSKMRGKELLLK